MDHLLYPSTMKWGGSVICLSVCQSAHLSVCLKIYLTWKDGTTQVYFGLRRCPFLFLSYWSKIKVTVALRLKVLSILELRNCLTGEYGTLHKFCSWPKEVPCVFRGGHMGQRSRSQGNFF